MLRKPNGNLLPFVDLRQYNSLIVDDFVNKNHTVNNSSDAAQQLAGKAFTLNSIGHNLTILLQLGDQGPLKMLASNLVRGQFACKGLARGLSRSQTQMRKYLHPVIKADQCAQYVDDFGFATTNTTDFTQNNRAVLELICETLLKLTVKKCHLESDKLNSLVGPSHEEEFDQKPAKLNISQQSVLPKIKKSLQR